MVEEFHTKNYLKVIYRPDRKIELSTLRPKQHVHALCAAYNWLGR